MATFWRAVVGRFVEATRARIEAEVTAGQSAGLDPGATAFALVWMTERTAYQEMVQGLGAQAELAEALTAIWLRTIYGRG